ncbi:ATP-binding cassette domain-containing protein [Gilvimarinus sp. DA14]|uniref:ATP-binding cassette domain-containing protein n=1 Tax=Gilvimarinus sp. DA14 TaxID=2956798 RepID=UPI0020B7E9E0|nr:ATP-binding cassette domain-containing protein [Gilvimarinus sp. DA14]UTF61829.1 ATP-binding cassette domain-containing protein [Gilvimarinus sp. DA14]
MSATAEFSININQIEYGHPRGPQWRLPRWQVAAGQTIFMQAPSGAGKSTLLHVLAGLLPVHHGELTVLNEPLHLRRPAQTAPWRAQQLGIIFQSLNLIDYLSCLDNILLAAHFAQNHDSGLARKAQELLAQLNLPPQLLQKKASELSLGQRQRVAIARALINDPALILADEPTSALDSDNRQDFINLLFTMVRQRNCTLIFASHDHSLSQKFNQRLALKELAQPL